MKKNSNDIAMTILEATGYVITSLTIPIAGSTIDRLPATGLLVLVHHYIIIIIECGQCVTNGHFQIFQILKACEK